MLLWDIEYTCNYMYNQYIHGYTSLNFEDNFKLLKQFTLTQYKSNSLLFYLCCLNENNVILSFFHGSHFVCDNNSYRKS